MQRNYTTGILFWYTSGMIKTAISLQESLYRQVNDLANELQIPRSRLFVLAIEAYLARRENRELLAALNAVYEAETEEEPLAAARMRQKQRQQVEGEW